MAKYTLNIKMYASYIYTSDIEEDVIEAFDDALTEDIDGIAEAIEKDDQNLAVLLHTIITTHQDNRWICTQISENLANSADYDTSDIKIKAVHDDCLDLTLPVDIDLNALELCLEDIKEDYEE